MTIYEVMNGGFPVASSMSIFEALHLFRSTFIRVKCDSTDHVEVSNNTCAEVCFELSQEV